MLFTSSAGYPLKRIIFTIIILRIGSRPRPQSSTIILWSWQFKHVIILLYLHTTKCRHARAPKNLLVAIILLFCDCTSVDDVRSDIYRGKQIVLAWVRDAWFFVLFFYYPRIIVVAAFPGAWFIVKLSIVSRNQFFSSMFTTIITYGFISERRRLS